MLFFTPGNSCCLLDSSRACGKPFLFTHFLVPFEFTVRKYAHALLPL